MLYTLDFYNAIYQLDLNKNGKKTRKKDGEMHLLNFFLDAKNFC